jgi:hypothetical protein
LPESFAATHDPKVRDELSRLSIEQDKLVKELSRITRAKKMPADWAPPEQRAKAALKALGK